MRIQRTQQAAPTTDGEPPTYANTETHWWDASQVYGSTPSSSTELRTHAGRQAAAEPPRGTCRSTRPTMRDLAGVNGNWWLGLAMLHTLFMREHNAICDRLGRRLPGLGRRRAVRARPAGQRRADRQDPHRRVDAGAARQPRPCRPAMRVELVGLLGERFGRRFGRRQQRARRSAGSRARRPDYHGAPYAMTEEFVAVYRMHPLIPDDYSLRARRRRPRVVQRTTSRRSPATTDPRGARRGADGRPPLLVRHRATPAPSCCTTSRSTSSTSTSPTAASLDLAAVDILRSRERGVPRYNEFRRKFHLAPATPVRGLQRRSRRSWPTCGASTATPRTSTSWSASTPRSRRRASRSATPRSGCSS